MKIEQRIGLPLELRSEKNTVKIAGYAAVFDDETNIGGYFREIIKPGAFKESVKTDDVVLLVNHEGLPLARTRSGTLDIVEDKKGLFIESELDDSDPDVQRLAPKMKRGDLDKMSFAFYIENRDDQEWDESDEDKIPLRIIHRARLDDVSIVNRPAYQNTEVGLRSLGDIRSERRLSREAQARLLQKRMRLDLAVRGH